MRLTNYIIQPNNNMFSVYGTSSNFVQINQLTRHIVLSFYVYLKLNILPVIFIPIMSFILV